MSPRIVLRLAAVSLAAVLASTACGGGRSARSDADGTAAVTAAAPAGPSSTLPGPTGPGYRSAIEARVVDNPAFDALQQKVVSSLNAVGLPGASLLVVHDGRLVEQEAWLDYTLDTRVLIASGSKWLSAATIMTLVDEGRLALDTPISTYLPRQLPDGKAANAATVTLRQLLSFTSGLAANEAVPCADDPDTTLVDCAGQFLARGLVHPPGEAFRYGSQHLLVAAAVAEVVSGVPFAELFQQRIARPLGMTQTLFGQVGTGRTTDVDHPFPAGGAASTLGDYGRFLEMLVHDGVAPSGTRILSAGSIAQMQTNHTENVRFGSGSEFRRRTRGIYGLGEWIDWTYPDGSTMVLSSDGAFGFRPWIDKKNGLFGVYLVLDKDKGYVEGDPDATSGDTDKVSTSGLWVFEMAAKAVGGSLPSSYYPHRR